MLLIYEIEVMWKRAFVSYFSGLSVGGCVKYKSLRLVSGPKFEPETPLYAVPPYRHVRDYVRVIWDSNSYMTRNECKLK